ncbi:MAG: FtsX-like permease family protein [Actinomycetota bacterium]
MVNKVEISAEERRFGISVLRALGLGRKKIFSLVVLEVIILGFVGSAFGIIMGSLLAKAMSQALAGFVVTELE